MDRDNDRRIFMMVEPNYATPFWFSQSIQGLQDLASKHKYSVVEIGNLSEVPGYANVIVVVGTNKGWVREALSGVKQSGKKPILIGGIPGIYGEDVSGTMYGGKTSMEEMVRYFHACRRDRIALVDINQNSSNDQTKCETFLSTAKTLGMNLSYKDIYYRGGISSNSTDTFLSKIKEYNGVIGSNDYVAAYILSYARENGINVPDDLFVAGLGDIMLCRYTSPSLTSATRSYYEAGQQVFRIWKILSMNPEVESVVSTMKSIIKPRGSTANISVEPSIQSVYIPTETDKIRPEVNKGTETVKSIQDCLSQCDYLDMKIIAGVMRNDSNEVLAEKLSMSPGTVNYRLKKLYRNAGVSTKNEFADLIKKHISVDTLTHEF